MVNASAQLVGTTAATCASRRRVGARELFELDDPRARKLGIYFCARSLASCRAPMVLLHAPTVALGDVLRHGRLQPLDSRGCIVNDCLDAVRPPWDAPLAHVMAEWRALEAIPGVTLVSVYARGSIPRGLGLAGRSDVDTIGVVIVAGGMMGEAAALQLKLWQEAASHRSDAAASLFPSYISGLDMSLVAADEASPLGRWLIAMSAGDAPVHPTGYGHPLSMFDMRKLDAFRIKTQGLRVHGANLAAGLPPFGPRQGGLAPRVRSDSSRAMDAFDRLIHEGRPAQARGVAVWLAKRALRAGMEMAAKDAGGYSRDLLPCYQAIAAVLSPSAAPAVSAVPAPEGTPGHEGGRARVESEVAAAALRALRLACARDGTGDGGCTGGPGAVSNASPASLEAVEGAHDLGDGADKHDAGYSGTAEAAEVMDAAVELARLVDHLHLELDERFTPLRSVEQLLAPPPLPDRWHPAPLPPLARMACAARVQLLRMTPPSLVSAAEGRLVSDALPQLQLPPLPEVTSLAWLDPPSASHRTRGRPAAASHSDRCRRIAGQFTRAARRPVVLRGAATQLTGGAYLGASCWNAVTMPTLVPAGSVRVSDGPSVVFCRDEHPMIDDGELAPPSRLIPHMGTGEFIARLGRGGGASTSDRAGSGWAGAAAPVPPPLFYGDRERVYMQADVPELLQAQWQVPPEWSGWGGARCAQPMRLWVSARGSISPLHFDSAGSFLCQLRGAKHVVLFPPAALDRLYPYPQGHPLYRRSRVDLYESGPRRARWFPAFDDGAASARQVLLEEGDVLLLPPLWWHHVETTSPLSVSVGARYV